MFEKPRAPRGIGGDGGRNDVERDRAASAGVAGAIEIADAAGAGHIDTFENLVLSEGLDQLADYTCGRVRLKPEIPCA